MWGYGLGWPVSCPAFARALRVGRGGTGVGFRAILRLKARINSAKMLKFVAYR